MSVIPFNSKAFRAIPKEEYDLVMDRMVRLSALEREQAEIEAEIRKHMGELVGMVESSYYSIPRPFVTTWIIAITVGVLSAFPIVEFQDKFPWLIAVPLCIGGLLAAVLEIKIDAQRVVPGVPSKRFRDAISKYLMDEKASEKSADSENLKSNWTDIP